MDHVIAFLIFHQMYTYVLMMKKKMNNDGNFLSVGNTLLSQDYRGLLLKVVGLFFVPIYQMSHVNFKLFLDYSLFNQLVYSNTIIV